MQNDMKAIAQITILIALATVAIIGLVSTPSESENMALWTAKLIGGKALALAGAAGLTVAYTKWRHTNGLLRRYERWCHSC